MRKIRRRRDAGDDESGEWFAGTLWLEWAY